MTALRNSSSRREVLGAERLALSPQANRFSSQQAFLGGVQQAFLGGVSFIIDRSNCSRRIFRYLAWFSGKGYIIKIKIHSSCEIEDFVETHLCKLCVILRSRALRVVCPH